VRQLFLPLALAFVGLILAFATYRDIRRGGARFYTLEREQILRRASFSLMLSVAFFLGAIGFFAYTFQRQAALEAEAAAAGQEEGGVILNAPQPELESVPPIPTITPTVDLEFALPTPTVTPIVCRAIVEGTGGNGLTLRADPGGQELAVLPDGSVLTLFQDEVGQESGGITWRKVRTITSQEGWVSQDFIRIGAPCN
jgi:hypothetical protein